MKEESSAWYKEVAWRRDKDWGVEIANQNAKNANKLSNFALGFSIFTLIAILFVELVVKK